jgi:hypothetical protein
MPSAYALSSNLANEALRLKLLAGFPRFASRGRSRDPIALFGDRAFQAASRTHLRTGHFSTPHRESDVCRNRFGLLISVRKPRALWRLRARTREHVPKVENKLQCRRPKPDQARPARFWFCRAKPVLRTQRTEHRRRKPANAIEVDTALASARRSNRLVNTQGRRAARRPHRRSRDASRRAAKHRALIAGSVPRRLRHAGPGRAT